MSRLVLHDAALADGSSDSLRLGVSVAIADGRIDAIGPNEAIDQKGADVVDAGGARVAAEAGVDSIEHGMELDDDVARTMKRNNVTLTSTLSVFASWESFARTTSIDRFTTEEGRQRVAKRKEGAYASVAAAKRAGVRIATGSDFGGGSVRAGHLAWEVELLAPPILCSCTVIRCPTPARSGGSGPCSRRASASRSLDER